MSVMSKKDKQKILIIVDIYNIIYYNIIKVEVVTML